MLSLAALMPGSMPFQFLTEAECGEWAGDFGGEVDFLGGAGLDVFQVDGFGVAFVEVEHDVFVVVFALHELDECGEFLGVAFDVVDFDRHVGLHFKKVKRWFFLIYRPFLGVG